jgi:flagellar hook-associated protein 1 FlgK
MASGLATNMNSQLAAGFAMDGTPGKPLFNFDPTSSNAMLTVNSSLVTQDLGFSSSASEPGDSSNLLTLIGLKDQPISVSSLGNVLLGDAYTQLVGRLGMDSQQNSVALSTAQTVRRQTEDSWKATSGVNSDEEAINLMQYQQMYQANMKVIAVANQLFDSVLDMLH